MPVRPKAGIMARLKEAGYPATVLRERKLLGEGAMQDLRKQNPVSIHVIARVCNLLGVQPGEVVEYVEDPADMTNNVSLSHSSKASKTLESSVDVVQELTADFIAQRAADKAARPHKLGPVDPNMPPEPELKFDYAKLRDQAAEAEKRRNEEDATAEKQRNRARGRMLEKAKRTSADYGQSEVDAYNNGDY